MNFGNFLQKIIEAENENFQNFAIVQNFRHIKKTAMQLSILSPRQVMLYQLRQLQLH
jgi:hypothetical protein